MVSLNKIVRAFTHEGARGKRFTPEMALKRALMNCLLWEDQFYEDGVAIAERIKALVKEVAPERVGPVNGEQLRHLVGALDDAVKRVRHERAMLLLPRHLTHHQ